MFNNKNILITGGTGSFGKCFLMKLINDYNPNKIIIFSRDEMKQWDLKNNLPDDSRLRFFIGDIRDLPRLQRASYGVNIIIHAAAMKIVPSIERDPFECIKTNIIGAMNVIDASIDNNVSQVIALSTDKASSPINLYGATKLASDKLFISGNQYSNRTKTRFSVVRYGNVMGSRGSVIPFFLKLKEKGLPLTITDKRMTRFMITLEQGVKLVETAAKYMTGGEIFVKKLPSMNIMDIAKVISTDTESYKFTGIRDGEKLHEEMISAADALNTYELDDFFVIKNPFDDNLPEYLSSSKQVDGNFSYSSDKNPQQMSIDELSKWVNQYLSCNGFKSLL